MCGIVTICNYQQDIREHTDKLKKMICLLKHRGPDHEGISITPHCLMGHRRLAIIDLDHGNQPMCYQVQQKTYRITYNGEIYNMMEIKKKLIELGYHFQTRSDTEVILAAYDAYHEKCVEQFEGIFAFVIDDGQQLFAARDQLGVKPLFYTYHDKTLVIASEIKCLLAYLDQAIVNETGICELLGLGPSMTPGLTVYQDIYALRPGHFLSFHTKPEIRCYWKLQDEPHCDSLEETIFKVRSLVIDSIQKQLISDVPISTMLSGGLDSSIITAVASQFVQPLATYSITYEEQEKYFQSYAYQTSMDDDYIQAFIKRYQPAHQNIILSQKQLIDHLEEALLARDMPGMADIDSSFLLFSQAISRHHKVCLSGECADEIFGGYPWFYQKALYEQPYFPWLRDIEKKIALFDQKIQKLDIEAYIRYRYQQSLQEIASTERKKKLIYLNTQWFMQTLLTRADSQTMRASIEVRVPFASTQICQYLYNMPEAYMFYQNEEKGILRKAFEDFLPPEITHRKKNPYPKTHSPIYAQMIQAKLQEALQDADNILFRLFDREQLMHLITTNGKDFKAPWFGQLMTGPQLLAYFYQIYLWGKIYHIQLHF